MYLLSQRHFLCPHGSPASPDHLQDFKSTREDEFSHHTPPGGRLWCYGMLKFHRNRNASSCIYNMWNLTKLNNVGMLLFFFFKLRRFFCFMTPAGSRSYIVFDNLPTVNSNMLHNYFCILLHVNVGHRSEEKKERNKSLRLTPQGDSSFVVMTNYIVTEGQKLGKCPEVSDGVPLSPHHSLFLIFCFSHSKASLNSETKPSAPANKIKIQCGVWSRF